jgi:hypothetical protein
MQGRHRRPSFHGAFSKGDMVMENGVEEETAVEGGGGVGTGHVCLLKVLDVVVDQGQRRRTRAGDRRKGSSQAAVARHRPGHEGAGMLLHDSVCTSAPQCCKP